MADVAKPFDPSITDKFADKAPRIENVGDRPRGLRLDVSDKTNDSNDTVDPKTLKVRRTFRDAAQAYSAYKRLKQQNLERNRKNQLIQKKLNNETPYEPKKLESMGQNWRSNRPTGFLSTMAGRVQAPFKATVEQAASLTFAKYPIESVDSERKTKIFREEITKCIRSWRGFDDLVAQVVHENTVFGYCALIWDDLRDWKPDFLRQDYVFFSVEQPQVADATPIFARKRRYLIAELLPVLEVPDISVMAGWHLKNLIKAINSATPTGRSLNSDDDARRVEDWIREGSYGASYESDAKYVDLGEVVVREPHGRVSRYLVDDKTGDEICTQLDRYAKMSDALALFSVDIGNGNLMSSRGVGRDLYNTHVAIDKSRNLVVDNTLVRSLLLLKKGPLAKPNIAPLTVSNPIAIVSEGYEVIPQSPPADIQDFIMLDNFQSRLAEIQIGTFLPSSAMNQGDPKTASEINRIASIENQIREGILTRFSRQFSLAVERMQRGIAHPEHIKAAADLKLKVDLARQVDPNAVWARREVVDAFEQSSMQMPPFLVAFEVPRHLDEDAVNCCYQMMERNLPPSDILLMAFSPAAELNPDTTAQDLQILDLMITKYMGNPNIDQDKLMKLDWTRKLGETIANEVILPKDSVEAIAIEATRQQIIELQSIIAGQEVPISPRDNDMVHLNTMAAKLAPVIQNIPPNGLPPEGIMPLVAAFGHFAQHIQNAEAKGAPREQLEPFKELYKLAAQQIQRGQNVPPPPDIEPAAAPPRGGGAPRRPSAAMQGVAGEAYTNQSGPSQNQVISEISNPPKPQTSAV
jgi:hypothetical protein